MDYEDKREPDFAEVKNFAFRRTLRLGWDATIC